MAIQTDNCVGLKFLPFADQLSQQALVYVTPHLVHRLGCGVLQICRFRCPRSCHDLGLIPALRPWQGVSSEYHEAHRDRIAIFSVNSSKPDTIPFTIWEPSHQRVRNGEMGTQS
jgi:hypothetical protein